MKAISVLGSTGSIGTQTLQIAEEFPDQFKIVALTAGKNLDLVIKQIETHQPEVVSLADESLLPELTRRINSLNEDSKILKKPLLMAGAEGLNTAAAWGSADLVVTGIVGCAGLLPTLAAIEAGKDLALANKETLIAAGPVVIPALKKSGSRLLPADSEHSAIFQCLQGTPWADNARLSLRLGFRFRSHLCFSQIASITLGISINLNLSSRNSSTAFSLAALSTAGIVPPNFPAL